MRFLPSLATAALLFLSASFAAFAGEAEDSFARGVESAREGDYRGALEHFLRARELGLDKPTLDYNLGVAYYRLGRYDEARKAFNRLARAKDFSEIAYFNLGLVANKTGDERGAIDWFLRAWHNTDDPRLKALAGKALERLGIDARKGVTSKKWGGFFAASLGYDSNVRLANEDLIGVTGTADNFAEVLGAANYWLTGGREGGFRILGTFDVQKYQDFGNYDFSQFQLAAAHYSRFGKWNLRLTGYWNESYLGGSGYQRILGADARGRYRIAGNRYLRLRYRFNNIAATDAAFEPLAGLRHQFRAGLQINRGTQRYRVYYQLDLNDRNDRVRATGFTSFSPTRHALRGIADLRIGGKWKARLDARYRFSGYNDPTTDSDVVTSPVTREDTQWRLGARLARNFARYWEVEGAYNYYDNSSNIVADSYKRHVVYLGVNRFF